MNFENYIELVEKTINNLISKYNVFHLRNDLLSESFICFERCRKKFDGDKKEFRFYFKKALERHLTGKIFEELEIMNKFVEIEDEIFEKERLRTEYYDIEKILKKAGLDEMEKKNMYNENGRQKFSENFKGD